jgi:predicted neutral ceramidase superfamily lipid hydrolase
MSAVIGDVRIIIDDPTQVPPEVVVRMFFGTVVNWLAGFALYTVFAVAWHRRTLVGPEATIGAALRWGRRQWRFFRRLVFLIVNLMVLMFLLAILLMAAVPIAPVLSALLIAIGLIYARVALVLPATATDKPMSVAESAKLTKGNSWRMFLAVVVLPLAVMLIGGLLVLILAAPLAGFIGSSMTARFLVSLVAQTVNYIGFAAGITALSLAYRQLTA